MARKPLDPKHCAACAQKHAALYPDPPETIVDCPRCKCPTNGPDLCGVCSDEAGR